MHTGGSRCARLARFPVALALCVACDSAAEPGRPFVRPPAPTPAPAFADGFTPLTASVACTPGGNPTEPLLLPSGYVQTVIASEPDYPDLPDMQTLNETGPGAAELLYRTHELADNGALSVTDLTTGVTQVVVRRSDWEALDGIVWTPWGTVLFAEERTVARRRLPDPQFPGARAGLVYELDPGTGTVTVRPAIGARAHEGLQFDSRGFLYGVSETTPGYLYRFVPDVWGDLSRGTLSVLRIVTGAGDGTGDADWVPLDRDSVQLDSDAAATRAGATGYVRPEDLQISPGDDVLYVATTGDRTAVPGRVLALQLHRRRAAGARATVTVTNFVAVGLNVDTAFVSPDNLAITPDGALFITEDPGTAPGTGEGDDIWMARPSAGNRFVAGEVQRFASLTDCDAEPTGIYFGPNGRTLYVNVMHRGGDRLDKSLAITRDGVVP